MAVETTRQSLGYPSAVDPCFCNRSTVAIHQANVANKQTNMERPLQNKTALVTASSGGIGQAIATKLAIEGARVIINGRSESSVNRAMDEIRGQATDADLVALAADLSTAQGVAEAISAHESVDILINNLGIFEAVDFFDITDDQWMEMFEVNVISGVRLTRHYLKKMLDQGTGRIVFISSESGVTPAPEMAHYSVTKAAQLSLSRSLAEKTRGTQVTVNTVMPGSTKTPGVETFVSNLFPDDSFEDAEKRFMKENRPTSIIGRLIEPDEIAAAVAFVASPAASAINGAALRVDGGIVPTMV
ncbi:3-oxoacyl-[acyl-carrier-protein] reductase FabG [Crateriforma conspicua]|uniref:3-oxoacyl-[acyl-carrier-protein] reductase FabG n=2 Tax=Crateriforma conspicua TaxID=2527996 RepID=A0A5C6FKV1_9PLAN|nr:3-oxoacyl-[acyl-carrier-protein] reductase FabG [Crateriforma conspicua]